MVLAEPEKLPKFAAIAANYRAELAIAEALAEIPDANAGLERAREELTSIRAQGGVELDRDGVAVVSGFLKDKATVDPWPRNSATRLK